MRHSKKGKNEATKSAADSSAGTKFTKNFWWLVRKSVANKTDVAADSDFFGWHIANVTIATGVIYSIAGCGFAQCSVLQVAPVIDFATYVGPGNDTVQFDSLHIGCFRVESATQKCTVHQVSEKLRFIFLRYWNSGDSTGGCCDRFSIILVKQLYK